MAYRKTLVSPRGREVIARTPADANDLLAQGYRIKPDPQPRKTSRKPRKAAEPAAEAEPATVDTAADEDSGE